MGVEFVCVEDSEFSFELAACEVSESPGRQMPGRRLGLTGAAS